MVNRTIRADDAKFNEYCLELLREYVDDCIQCDVRKDEILRSKKCMPCLMSKRKKAKEVRRLW